MDQCALLNHLSSSAVQWLVACFLCVMNTTAGKACWQGLRAAVTKSHTIICTGGAKACGPSSFDYQRLSVCQACSALENKLGATDLLLALQVPYP